jgi:predicted transcriptional regulator YheO
MEKEQFFNALKQVADLTTKMFGQNCEVAIYDLAQESKQLVYITGNVTKRQPGTPVSDVVAKYLIQEGNVVQDRHCFPTLTDNGSEIKSSTAYLRDSNGKVLAAFCINFNTTDHHNAIQLLETFVNVSDIQGRTGSPSRGKRPEKLTFSIDHTVDAMFEEAIKTIGKRPVSMSTDEKIRLVKNLEDKGAFQIKGVVNQIALRLGVSNFTIYNYLKKIRADNGKSLTNIL